MGSPAQWSMLQRSASAVAVLSPTEAAQQGLAAAQRRLTLAKQRLGGYERRTRPARSSAPAASPPRSMPPQAPLGEVPSLSEPSPSQPPPRHGSPSGGSVARPQRRSLGSLQQLEGREPVAGEAHLSRLVMPATAPRQRDLKPRWERGTSPAPSGTPWR